MLSSQLFISKIVSCGGNFNSAEFGKSITISSLQQDRHCTVQ
jgi:hypothetical protein